MTHKNCFKTDGMGGACDALDGGFEAGLVPYKTSDTLLKLGSKFISFDKQQVVERSVKSMRRKLWSSSKLLDTKTINGKPVRAWFVTLTYRGVHDWSPRHITGAVKAYREWCRRRGVPCKYCWVAELQKRGAVHYHLVAWLPARLSMPMWDKQGWWRHGYSNTEKVKVTAIGYLMKYVSKISPFHEFPKGCRKYSVGGLDYEQSKIPRWLAFPQWVKEQFGVGDVFRQKSGLVLQATGEILEPMYHAESSREGLRIIPLRTAIKTFAGFAGPFSTLSHTHA
jgi:hypothetical protein